jgi:RNA polymerase sigma factor (sigma-70 family)
MIQRNTINPMKHQGLVAKVALRLGIRPHRHEFDDAMQDGNIGLLYACRHFDFARGVAFNTYAWKCIRGMILRGRCVGVPQASYWKDRGKIRSIQRPEQLNMLLSVPAKDNAVENAVDAEYLARLLLDLTPKQRERVVLRYWGGMTFEDIGNLSGTTRQNAQLSVRLALKKLRKRALTERAER